MVSSQAPKRRDDYSSPDAADTSDLIHELELLGASIPSDDDVILARARVRDAFRQRVVAWRNSTPALNLTSARTPAPRED